MDKYCEKLRFAGGEEIDVQREGRRMMYKGRGGIYIAMEAEKKNNLKYNKINLIYLSLDQIVLSHSPRQSRLEMSKLPHAGR